MKTTAIILSSVLALGGLTACGDRSRSYESPVNNSCSAYEDEVLDLDDEGLCEEDEDGKKKRKKKTSGLKNDVRKKTTKSGSIGGSTKRSGGISGGTKRR